MNTNPVRGFIRTLFLFLSFRVKYSRKDVGRIITMQNEQTFRIFRHVIIKAPNATPPQDVFIVRFRPTNMSVQQNIRFSLLPMLIFMGFQGFREKFWCVDDATGLCQGAYAWQTEQDAQNYANSIAMRFMTHWSDPASVTARVISQAEEPFWLFQQD